MRRTSRLCGGGDAAACMGRVRDASATCTGAKWGDAIATARGGVVGIRLAGATCGCCRQQAVAGCVVTEQQFVQDIAAAAEGVAALHGKQGSAAARTASRQSSDTIRNVFADRAMM